jgi:Zn-dependent protease with chaperone function
MRVLALALAITLFPVAATHAQPAGETAAGGASVAPSAPPRDFVAEVRANFTPENRAYASTRSALAFVDPFYTIVVAFILLSSGLSAKMRDMACDLVKSRYARVLVYFALFSIVSGALLLPLEWAGDFALEHRYGLSNQSLGGWLNDQAKALGLQIVFLGVLPTLALAYRRLETSPRRWWLWFGALSLPFITATFLIQPLIVEPAFNKFTPLRDEHLRGRILALAARAGIPAGRVDEVDRSEQTNKYNAYVSGFGASQHIVIWDTTLRGMDEREILFVTGHEIGHYKLGHIWKGIVIDSLLSLGVFFLTWLVGGALARRFGPSWGFTQLHDLASMPMLAVVLNTVVFAFMPAYNAFSRVAEHEADVYALEITHDNDAGARSFIKMGMQNRSDPEPSELVKWLQFTHPPLIERVRFAVEYHPWREGRPNRFFQGPVPPVD